MEVKEETKMDIDMEDASDPASPEMKHQLSIQITKVIEKLSEPQTAVGGDIPQIRHLGDFLETFWNGRDMGKD